MPLLTFWLAMLNFDRQITKTLEGNPVAYLHVQGRLRFFR